jgi:hypothetical protein
VSERERNTLPKTSWPLISGNKTQNKRSKGRRRVISAKAKEKYLFAPLLVVCGYGWAENPIRVLALLQAAFVR